jgi:hypothetical protein
MLRVKDVIVDVASVDREQHLPRHSLITTQATFTVIEEALASCFNCELACIRSIDARSKLALDVDTKCIGGFLVGEVFALALTLAVVVIDKPSRFGFACWGGPGSFAD